jgi:hypothetical protein
MSQIFSLDAGIDIKQQPRCRRCTVRRRLQRQSFALGMTFMRNRDTKPQRQGHFATLRTVALRYLRKAKQYELNASSCRSPSHQRALAAICGTAMLCPAMLCYVILKSVFMPESQCTDAHAQGRSRAPTPRYEDDIQAIMDSVRDFREVIESQISD